MSVSSGGSASKNRYHFNAATGKSGKCSAQSAESCPVSGEDGVAGHAQHFSSMEEAKQYEIVQAEKKYGHDTFTSSNKTGDDSGGYKEETTAKENLQTKEKELLGRITSREKTLDFEIRNVHQQMVGIVKDLDITSAQKAENSETYKSFMKNVKNIENMRKERAEFFKKATEMDEDLYTPYGDLHKKSDMELKDHITHLSKISLIQKKSDFLGGEEKRILGKIITDEISKANNVKAYREAQRESSKAIKDLSQTQNSIVSTNTESMSTESPYEDIYKKDKQEFDKKYFGFVGSFRRFFQRKQYWSDRKLLDTTARSAKKEKETKVAEFSQKIHERNTEIVRSEMYSDKLLRDKYAFEGLTLFEK